jgi:hypothetical protein
MVSRKNSGAVRATDTRIEILLAEYGWVSGQITFYRQVEVTALGATGVVLSAVVSVVAVLEGGKPSNRAAEATLLSASAWAPTLLLLVEIMALTRIRRAALYILEYLRPLACSLAGDEELLQWEALPPEAIFFRRAGGSKGWRFAVKVSVSSAPVVVAIGSVAVALAIAGAWIHPTGPWTAWVLVIGYVAAFMGLCLAAYGVVFSFRHEARHGVIPPADAAGVN